MRRSQIGKVFEHATRGRLFICNVGRFLFTHLRVVTAPFTQTTSAGAHILKIGTSTAHGTPLRELERLYQLFTFYSFILDSFTFNVFLFRIFTLNVHCWHVNQLQAIVSCIDDGQLRGHQALFEAKHGILVCHAKINNSKDHLFIQLPGFLLKIACRLSFEIVSVLFD